MKRSGSEISQGLIVGPASVAALATIIEGMHLDFFHPLIARVVCRADSASRPNRSSAAGRKSPPGDNTLIAAPTGSGKTLAAFLVCLDRLLRRWLDGTLEDKT